MDGGAGLLMDGSGGSPTHYSSGERSPPRYMRGETARQRSSASKSHRAKGEKLRKEVKQQRTAREHKVSSMQKSKSRQGDRVRNASRQIGVALERANSAYRELASSYVAELRHLPEDGKRAKEQLVETKAASANEKRVQVEEWEQRRVKELAKRQKSARAARDGVRSQRKRGAIPAEMDAQMRRLGIGPYANHATIALRAPTGGGSPQASSPADGSQYDA